MTPSPIDWWDVYHNAMVHLPWASPEAIGKLTIKQLLCLAGTNSLAARKLDSAADFEACIAERRAAQADLEREWNEAR